MTKCSSLASEMNIVCRQRWVEFRRCCSRPLHELPCNVHKMQPSQLASMFVSPEAASLSTPETTKPSNQGSPRKGNWR